MLHIRQTDSTNECYTVVRTGNWQGAIDQHPCLINHPDDFELVDEVIPENAQYLDYTNPEE